MADFGGLLDFIKTPEGQGLLSAAFGGLAGAQKGAPLNSLGRSGMSGLMGYGQAQDREKQMAEAAQMGKFRDLQMQQSQMRIADMQAKADQEKRVRELIPQFQTPAKPATSGGFPSSFTSSLPQELQTGTQIKSMPAQPAQPASFDREGFAAALEGVDPMRGLTYRQSIQKDNTPIAVKADETLVDKNTFKPLFTAPKTLNKPAEQQGYELAQAQGYSGSFMDYQTALKKAGATNVSTKVETKMGDSLAGQVGPMVKDTYTAAQGAVQQVDAAQRIIKAIDSGKVIAGPMANTRMTVAQIGQLVGVTGKDDAETIARSRDVIRGLSEMTLQGRKQMSGQGAITESEGKLAEKANSGDINDLTPAEIKQLARASARAANFIYSQHQDNLTNLQSNPDTSRLAGFYKVRPMPKVDMGEQPAVNVDDLVGKYRSK
jgi:hypothetical protein